MNTTTHMITKTRNLTVLQAGAGAQPRGPVSSTWPDNSHGSSSVFDRVRRTPREFAPCSMGQVETATPGTDQQTIDIDIAAAESGSNFGGESEEDPLRLTLRRRTPRADGGDEQPWRRLTEHVRLASHKRVPGTRYEIIRWLGEGGMGVVFEAVHIDIRRPVALKILKPDSFDAEDQRDRFLAEARAIAAIDSRFVVDVLDFGELPDGRPFYTMELLEPANLYCVLRDEGPLPLSRALPILRQCCKALAAVHERGIAHRDIKPENVLLQREQDRGDAVRLVDFGIAAKFGTQPQVAGTVMYMAPEQIRGSDFDGCVDIYALGCIAFEMLTGAPPFEGASVVAVVDKHLHEPPPKLSARRPKLPTLLDDVLAKCLAKRPSDRYQSMAELEAALCEVQIEAALRTAWDDLPLPLIEDAARHDLRERMPSQQLRHPWLLRPRLQLAAGAFLVGMFSALAGFASRVHDAPASTSITDIELDSSEVREMVERAREAASRAYWAYPPASNPEAPTALAWVQELERESTPLRPLAGVRAMQLRKEFASTLVRLGDRYWDDPHGRPFAGEYYIQALLFDDEHPRALERVSMTRNQIAEFSSRIARREFVEVDFEIASILRALAETDETRRRDRVQRLLGHEQLAAHSLRTQTELSRLVGIRDDEAEQTKADDEVETSEPTVDDEPEKDEKPTRHERQRALQLVDKGQRALAWGRRDRARALFSQALELDPELGDAHAGIAQIHFAQGNYAQAMFAARRAARAKPGDAELQLLLGDACLKSARYERARQAYTRAGRLGHHQAERRLGKLEGLLR
jgi:serine/threonine protein kinase